MNKETWIIIALLIVMYIILPITSVLIYKYIIVPLQQKTSPNINKESFDETDKSAFFDALLNSNAETQQLFLNMIDADTGLLHVNEMKLGEKTLTQQTLTSKSGTAKHNDYVTPPTGTTDDFNIIVSPGRMGRGEPNSEQDNALLKFTCTAKPESNKAKWKIECTYKYRTQNTGNGTMYYDGQVNYLIVPK